jgi:hypothetical protein
MNVQQSTDDTSINRYFRRTETRDVLVLSDVDVFAQSQYLLSVTKDPGFRFDFITIGVAGANDTSTWTAVLSSDISTRITVNRTPKTGASISQQAFIEAIGWDITSDGDWRVTWQLSPASTTTGLTLDHATLGKLDSGNTLAY